MQPQHPCPVCGGPTYFDEEGRRKQGHGSGERRSAGGIILPSTREEEEDEGERPRKEHPRHGFTAALFLGTVQLAEGFEQQYLVEVVEQYNVWGDESSKGYHYQPHDLTRGTKMDVKTVGSISFDPSSDEVPPFVDMAIGDPHRRRGHEIGWRRIR